MNPFGVRDPRRADSEQRGNPEEIVTRLDAALTSIFNEDGKRTVLYYLTSKFGVTLEQASAEPAKLEKALTGLLGQVGWMVVKKAILEEFWHKKIGLNETALVERASLRDVFGFVHGFSLGHFMMV